MRNIILLTTFLLCGVCSGLTDADVAQLVFVEQTELPRMMVDRIAFMPDGVHVIAGGWLEWPNAPLVALLPNDVQVMQAAAQACSPRFAVSPDGQRVAFWKRVRVGQQDRGELTVAHLDNQMVTTLGEPVPISESMHLAWLPNGPIVYATEDPQRPVGVLYALDLAGGRPRKLLELHDGQWRNLQPGPGAGQVTAQWAGTSLSGYVVNCLPGETVPPVGSAVVNTAPDGTSKTLEVDAQGSLILGLSDTEGVVVDRGVRAACWRTDGTAILYVKDQEVFVVGPSGTEPRALAKLGSQDANVFLRGCAWAPDGVSVAYWGAAGSGGRAWRASLGQERISARLMFAKDAPVKADTRVWVVGKLQRDVMGNIVEPVWSTLKGCFTVRRILRTPEGILAEAQNSGSQSGLIERLSPGTPTGEGADGHINIGIAGQTAATWSRTSTLKFRDGLVGWLEKTRYVGQPETLTVERQMLQPIGQ